MITVLTPRSPSGRPMSVVSDDGGNLVFGATPTPADAASRAVLPFTHATHGENLQQNGSATSLSFTVSAHATLATRIHEVRLLLVGRNLKLSGGFAGSMSALTNGLALRWEPDGGAAVVLGTYRRLLDFWSLPVPPTVDRTDPAEDTMVASFLIGGACVLAPSSGDQLVLAVQDNLTSTQLLELRAWALGIREVV